MTFGVKGPFRWAPCAQIRLKCSSLKLNNPLQVAEFDHISRKEELPLIGRLAEAISHHDDRLGRAVSVLEAVVRQQSQEGVENQRGRVAQVQERLHQWDGAHGPVAAELRGVEQKPGVDGEKVVEGHLPGRSWADGSGVVEPLGCKVTA